MRPFLVSLTVLVLALTGAAASAEPPAPTTGAASEITGEGAVLHGTLRADTSARVAVEWGTEKSALSARTGALEVERGASALTVPLTGLPCGTTFWYRFTAESETATAEAGLQSFRTAPCAAGAVALGPRAESPASLFARAPRGVFAAVAYSQTRFVVKPLRRRDVPARLAALHTRLGTTVRRRFDRFGGAQVIEVPAGRPVEELIARYQASGLVEFAEPDFIRHVSATPNDPYYTNGSLWGHYNTGQSGGSADADMDSPEAWDTITDASNVIVEVIDTGVNTTHEDLASNLWTNTGEIAGNGIDDDANGFVDDVQGVDTCNDDVNPTDDNGHGTHVAGIIGAKGNNGVGVVGVAWTAKILPCKSFSSGGSATDIDSVVCMFYAVNKGVKIVNASWGGSGYSSWLKYGVQQLHDAGIVLVTAAGNDALDLDSNAQYPAKFNLDNIVVVAAINRGDGLASFSNYSSTYVDVGAPGTSIYSTYYNANNSYTAQSGTSMATPQVAGAMALTWAKFPALSYSQLISRILLSGDTTTALTGKTVSGKRVNVGRAVNMPYIATQPQPITIATGTTTTLTVSATGTTTLSYQWYEGSSGDTGTPASGTTASFTTPALSADKTYWVRVTNSWGSVDSDAATVTIGQGASITSHPAAATIYWNDTTTLSVTATGTAPLTYQWYTGTSGNTTSPIGGATSSSYTTPALTTSTNYWVKVSGTYGNASSSTAAVTVLLTPKITSQPASQTVISGNTATLSVAATGPTTLSYQWYLGASGTTTSPVAGATASSYTTPAITTSTSYWVKVTDSAGSTNSDAATLTPVTTPVITQQPSSPPVCSGDTATLTVVATGTAPLTYQWKYPTGGNVPGATDATYTKSNMTSPITRWVRVSNGFGSADSPQVTIELGDPLINDDPDDVTIARGSTTTLATSATALIGTVTFQWYLGAAGDTSSPIAGATGAEYTTSAVTSPTTYWVQAINECGTAQSAAATVSVGDPPTISTQPVVSTTISSGNTVTLSVVGSGTGSQSYKWYEGSSGITESPIQGSNSATYTTPAITSSTSYWVRITNTYGNADSSTATITVGNPVIDTEPQSVTITSGTSTTLSVGASGEGTLSYQWYTGTSGTTTSPVSGATSSSYTTPTLTATTTYWVRVTNAYGTVDSATATVTVPGAPTISTQPTSSSSICSGSTKTLSVTASGATSYQWYVGTSGTTTSPVSGATSSSYTTPALTTTTKYWVLVSNATGGTNSNTATVNVGNLAVSSQPQSVYIVSGQTATFSVAMSGSVGTKSYQWFRGTSGTTTNPIGGAFNASFTTNALTTTTSYWVQVDDNCSTVNSSTATANVGTAPGITTQPASATISSGASVTLSVVASGSGTKTYQWYRGSSGTTTDPISGATGVSYGTGALVSTTAYWVRVTTGWGSVDSNTATVTIGNPTISVQPQGTTLSAGTTTTMSVTASGSGTLAYQWYTGVSGNTASPVSGATASSTTTPSMSSTTSYWVRVSNAYGTANSSTATVTVGNPSISAQPQDATILSGATATLSVTASGSGALDYQWYLGASGDTASPIGGANDASYTTPALTSDATYWVAVSNTYGTTSSNAATVTIGTAPGISQHPAGTTIASGTTTTLSVTASGMGTLTYQWYQGTSGQTGSPVAAAMASSFTTPALTTQTSYWVRVSNAWGSADSSTATIDIGQPASIDVDPSSIVISSGTGTTLGVTAGGTPTLVYQWYVGTSGDLANPIAGATGASYATGALTVTKSYWVRVSNTYGSDDSATATVTIGNPAIAVQPQDATIGSGQTATLGVTATAPVALSYQWYQGASGNTGSPIGGATSASYTTPALTSAASYWVRVSNGYGSVDSATATVTIGNPAISTHPQGQTLLEGRTATLSVTASGPGTLSYQWYEGVSGATGAPVPGATASSFVTPQLASSTSYWVRVSNAYGGTDSTAAVLTVLPAKTLTVTVVRPRTGVGSVTADGIRCGSAGTDCRQAYVQGATVTLKAAADAGAVFAGWSGDCAGTGTRVQVTMSVARSCTATFASSGVRFSAAAYPIGQGAVRARIVVKRLGSLARTASVAYRTVDGTALAGTDYRATAGTLIFARGAAQASFSVSVMANGPTDGDRSLTLALSGPTGTVLLEPRTAILTIQDAP